MSSPYIALKPEPRDPLASSDESVHSHLSDHYLAPEELVWRRRQPWLESQGYALRPRFRPGWIPSWTVRNTEKRDAEDSLELQYLDTIDATRVSDGRPVHIKRITAETTWTDEVDITLFFSSEPLKSDPRNHCVPVLDVLQRPEERCTYLILPALRRFDSPRFLTVGEAIDFIGQIFEGLLFTHEHSIAHRDCGSLNVMMDASQLYPESFHPVEINKSRDLRGRARHFTRTECKPRYYLIDFGLSVHYDPQSSNWPPSERKVYGVDKSVPEYHDLNGLHNPFPTDVYYIGNLIREDFLQRFKGLSFLDQLISCMVQNDPNRRPQMHEVVSLFGDISRNLSYFKLRSRLAKRNEFVVIRCWRLCAHVMRAVRYEVTGIPPIKLARDTSAKTLDSSHYSSST